MSDPLFILYVDDDVDLATFVGLELEAEGYRVELAHDGMKGLMAYRQKQPDLLILDWEMPGMSGLDICRQVRRSSHLPILMLTGKREVNDRVEGLDAGANDYLVKPFDLQELLARVRALARLVQPQELYQLDFADISMDLKQHAVQRAGQSIALTPTEYELLKTFLQHPNQVLSKSQLIEKVWGWDAEMGENNLEFYIHALRQKLEQYQGSRLIHNKRGVGYLLQEE